MLELRKGGDRGHFDHGWLKSWHTFSFSEYYDEAHMNFRVLRVINEDKVSPHTGFPLHPHKDMEIVTYMISGALTHQDSLGNKGTIQSGEIQRMTAGTGIRHSEANSGEVEAHLLQIWLLPNAKGLTPSWEQVAWRDRPVDGNGLRLLASKDSRSGSALIHQDVDLWHGSMNDKQSEMKLALAPGRYGWLQITHGQLTANGQAMTAGDGLAVSDEAVTSLATKSEAEFLWFDLP